MNNKKKKKKKKASLLLPKVCYTTINSETQFLNSNTVDSMERLHPLTFPGLFPVTM